MTNSVQNERRKLQSREADLAASVARLSRELAEVQDERGKVAYALAVLDRLVERDTAAPHASTDSPRRQAGGTYEIAMRTINDSGRKWRVDELVREMRGAGWDATVKDEIETVRAALSRGAASGEVTRPTHGVYAPRESETDAPQRVRESPGTDVGDTQYPYSPAES